MYLYSIYTCILYEVRVRQTTTFGRYVKAIAYTQWFFYFNQNML
jgi:hypothetical protein